MVMKKKIDRYVEPRRDARAKKLSIFLSLNDFGGVQALPRWRLRPFLNAISNDLPVSALTIL